MCQLLCVVLKGEIERGELKTKGETEEKIVIQALDTMEPNEANGRSRSFSRQFL